ncbi:hypothetical protein [Anaerosinus gibii]|uniref:Uncharacterized protein n=1 Tax=Selenobaculum gibii TaxID=3054208 RepID=A0A9Y2AI33_9FIRM|nr:hypothetical protein [Selenobaculum gbiensis]WIW70176.1 hypothetical protein P3F81_09770 [Selenobaculum gbiensis]
MFSWRITKYNPVYRDEFDKYTCNEWTSFSDIGKTFNEYKVTKMDYIIVEDAYIDTIVAFMSSNDIKSLKVVGIEKCKFTKMEDDFYSEKMINLYHNLKENDILNVEEIKILARMILREDLWCKLEHDNIMYIHFGYDYYMYICSWRLCKKAIKGAINMGLFVEEYESPYK